MKMETVHSSEISMSMSQTTRRKIQNVVLIIVLAVRSSGLESRMTESASDVESMQTSYSSPCMLLPSLLISGGVTDLLQSHSSPLPDCRQTHTHIHAAYSKFHSSPDSRNIFSLCNASDSRLGGL